MEHIVWSLDRENRIDFWRDLTNPPDKLKMKQNWFPSEAIYVGLTLQNASNATMIYKMNSPEEAPSPNSPEVFVHNHPPSPHPSLHYSHPHYIISSHHPMQKKKLVTVDM